MHLRKLNAKINNILNESMDSFNDYKRLYKDLETFEKDMLQRYPGDKEELVDNIDAIRYVIETMWDDTKLHNKLQK